MISASDSFDNIAPSQTIAVAVTPLLPVLTAPASELLQQGSVTAVPGIGLSEAGATAGETFTVILRDTYGDLAATPGGATVSGGGGTGLAISGSLADVNAALATVTDTNATIGPDPILLSATDSFNNTASPQTITATTILTLSQLATEHATIDWNSLEASLRPASIDAPDWDVIWTRFIDQVGTTTDDLVAALTRPPRRSARSINPRTTSPH